MSDSAESSLRAERRRETTLRIHGAALRLTDAHGLDGFTLDELAAAAGVSRRTLFNYFPSKVDAVLGPMPDLDDDHFAEFAKGGPTGDLVEDVIVLARHVVGTTSVDRELLVLGRRVILAEPRLLLAAHERFEQLGGELVAPLVARQGPAFGHARAQLLLRVLVSTYDVALDQALARDDDEVGPEVLPDLVAAHIRTLREIFGG